MPTTILCLIAALAPASPLWSQGGPPYHDLAKAVVRLPSHGASATVIETAEGRSLLLGCGHAFRDSHRQKPITVDAQDPQAGQPRTVGIRLLAVDYQADLSLVELRTGPLPYVAHVAPAGHTPSPVLLSVGFDEMRWPPTQKTARFLNTEGATTFTVDRPWHGRSGGALLDTQAGYLVGVVSGYETTGQRRGIYVSHQAILRFLASQRGGVYGLGYAPRETPTLPRPGIGFPQLSAPPRFHQPCPPSG